MPEYVYLVDKIPDSNNESQEKHQPQWLDDNHREIELWRRQVKEQFPTQVPELPAGPTWQSSFFLKNSNEGLVYASGTSLIQVFYALLAIRVAQRLRLSPAARSFCLLADSSCS